LIATNPEEQEGGEGEVGLDQINVGCMFRNITLNSISMYNYIL
jgi:hypothetical protein